LLKRKMDVPQGPVRAVLFDLDDTLLDWSGFRGDVASISRPHVSRLYGYLAGMGYALPDEADFHHMYETAVTHAWTEAKKTWAGVNVAQTLSACFDALALDPTHIDMDAALRAYDWQPVPGVRPYDDTIPVLEALHRQHYKLGLITNSMMPMWMRDVELQTYGLLDYFPVRLTSGDVGYMKPHPRIYQQALALLGVSPAEAVFIGDRPANDIAGANDAGITSVLMAPSHLQYELNGVLPDFTINRLSDLLPILAAL
jgi:HAD superfamily hydrolase (TIGR01509 family)